eukprot:6174553-Pleurochrysis_carterae.AAC.1
MICAYTCTLREHTRAWLADASLSSSAQRLRRRCPASMLRSFCCALAGAVAAPEWRFRFLRVQQ